MNTLTEAERTLVRRRRRLATAWPWVGGGLLAAWVGLFGWLWATRAALVDPRRVWAALADGSMPAPDWQLLAAMTPVLFWVLFVLVLALVLIAFGYHLQERRLLALLERLTAPVRPPAG